MLVERSLDDKYTAVAGDVVMSGIQALVRLPLDQHRRDREAGLRTATLVTGYRGSPLGTLDLAFARAKDVADAHHVHFLNGINEDLAATAVFGSQLANTFPQPRYDGVLGMWYGKGPGVDRSGDAFRHANTAGVGRHGGVLALAGDDPAAKSSTVASASEFTLHDASMPILSPGTVQEVIELGLAGFALSRFSGSWVGMKIVTNVADAFATVRVGAAPPIVVPSLEIDGRPWAHTQNPALITPFSLGQEREMYEGRSVAAREFIAANRINELVVDPADAWLGIVAGGKTYRDVVDALGALGLDESALHAAGVRVLRLGALHPLEPGIVRYFARGLDEIVVVEEKRAFVELFLRELLYGTADAPRIVGKRDEHDTLLLPGHGELDADIIRPVLRARLLAKLDPARLRPEPAVERTRELIPLSTSDARTPYFCSGCPHNRSTLVPEGSLANAGIGCSTMAVWMDRHTENVTQMGGEGAQWVGAAPFTELTHLFQNIGDGTLLHSGSLAIRQAVAAGTNVTYKLLYNAAVAMTGGQTHDADLPLAAIVRSLLAEGVERVLVVSDDPDGRRREMPDGVDVWHRDRSIEAQELLREIPGVTVFVYDQACAAERRRKRKRGLVETPARRIMINEAVCEGCGDCGAKSNCLSVQPVDTLLGRKTQIHQSSCNLDETCTTGHCPAFVTVEPAATGGEPAHRRPPGFERLLATDLPAPTRSVPAAVNVLMTGVGGTGVVTINQILGVAAWLDGSWSTGLDQTGLAQKGGSVVSHLRIAPAALDGASVISRGRADVLLAFDPVTAAQDVNLGRCAPGVAAIVNTTVSPTGPSVRDVNAPTPSATRLFDRLDAAIDASRSVRLDAERLSADCFGDHLPANMIVVGAAYQAGLLPLSAAAIDRAIELNGAAVATNRDAFRIGRLAVVDPQGLDAAVRQEPAGVVPAAPAELPRAVRAAIDAAAVPAAALDLVTFCAADLVGYQSADDALRYLADVAAAARRELPGRSELTVVVARELHHLMAVKDEYEVARLHRSAAFRQAVAAEFGDGAEVRYLLHPPALRRFVKGKLSLGPSGRMAFRVLARAKRLRGTAFDVFGRSAHRRMERALPDEFRAQVRRVLEHLDAAALDEQAAAYDAGVAALALANGIRGFDHVKERNVAAWREASAAALDQLTEPAPIAG